MYQEQANLFKALMHPARLAILNMLKDGEECVCHMEAALGYRQAYISQQLSVLKEAGLVQDRRDGWNIFYRVIKPQIFNLLAEAEKITGQAEKPQPAFPDQAGLCPCPKCSQAPVKITG
jgi:DNA-binding transcriptional ArsR family regulator